MTWGGREWEGQLKGLLSSPLVVDQLCVWQHVCFSAAFRKLSATPKGTKGAALVLKRGPALRTWRSHLLKLLFQLISTGYRSPTLSDLLPGFCCVDERLSCNEPFIFFFANRFWIADIPAARTKTTWTVGTGADSYIRASFPGNNRFSGLFVLPSRRFFLKIMPNNE